MVDFKGSDCLSVEECVAVFEHHHEWAHRLLVKASTKEESNIVQKVASIMDEYFPSSEETRLLKGILL